MTGPGSPARAAGPRTPTGVRRPARESHRQSSRGSRPGVTTAPRLAARLLLQAAEDHGRSPLERLGDHAVLRRRRAPADVAGHPVRLARLSAGPVLLRVPRHRALARRRARGRLGRHPDPARGRRRLVAVRRLRAAAGALPAGRRRPAGAAGVGEGRGGLGQAQGALRQRADLEGPASTCSPSCRSASSRHPAGRRPRRWSFWFVAMPFFSLFDVPIINGTWVPPLWFGLVCLPLGILVFFVALHVLNGVELGVRALGRGDVPRAAARGVAAAGGAGAAPPPAPPAAGRRSGRRRRRRAAGARRPRRRRAAAAPAAAARRAPALGAGAPARRRDDELTMAARGGDPMRDDRVLRVLRPSLALAALAAVLVLLGLAIAGPAHAVSKSPTPAASNGEAAEPAKPSEPATPSPLSTGAIVLQRGVGGPVRRGRRRAQGDHGAVGRGVRRRHHRERRA